MILAVSGKISSGKDLVGEIVQIITQSPHFTDKAVENFLGRELINPKFKNKKFADKLKDMVCLLLNCTRQQLEDREFKEKELGEEWWSTKIRDSKTGKTWLIKAITHNEIQEYLNTCTNYTVSDGAIKLTPRLLLQLLGTECGRYIIHPNIWVNALMSEYKSLSYAVENGGGKSNWIITDMRFPNEFKAVKDRNGIVIRVERWINEEYDRGYVLSNFEKGIYFGIDENGVESLLENKKDVDNFERFVTELNWSTHESETALDNHKFDYVINNNGSLSELVVKVREILTERKVI
jgi:hypothetical protein